MEQVFWYSDDDLQDWQKELLSREFKLNNYGHIRNAVFRKNSEGEVKKDLPE
tara:strand:+ start:262 stop:417 length:156 start_codon:yes stop_codon:yes gene_type:complete